LAAARGGAGAAVIDKLTSEPFRFEFFQAVRLLERSAFAQRLTEDGDARMRLIGRDHSPREEPVRFRALPSLSFASSAISRIGKPKSAGDDDHNGTLEMFVSFFGLTGPAGVLPQHYTALLIERLRESDFSLRDFLDLFNHRLVSLFYRAWEKYRFPMGYERARLGRRGEDHFTGALFSLVGLGTGGMRKRLTVEDEAIAYYGGHFAHRPRSATAMEQILRDYFDVPATLEQFVGQWLRVEQPDRTQLTSRGPKHPTNNVLGTTAFCGTRVWDVQSRFRIRLGPLTYEQYCRFLPDSTGLAEANDLASVFAGPQFDFDVQPVLLAHEVPKCKLGVADPVKRCLGRNIWLKTKSFTRNFDRAAFEVSRN
jgi:type VI secretion system protein ImpH